MEQTLAVQSMLMNVQEKLQGVPEIPMSSASIYQDLSGKTTLLQKVNFWEVIKKIVYELCHCRCRT